jgi:hypothetical protein
MFHHRRPCSTTGILCLQGEGLIDLETNKCLDVKRRYISAHQPINQVVVAVVVVAAAVVEAVAIAQRKAPLLYLSSIGQRQGTKQAC